MSILYFIHNRLQKKKNENKKQKQRSVGKKNHKGQSLRKGGFPVLVLRPVLTQLDFQPFEKGSFRRVRMNFCSGNGEDGLVSSQNRLGFSPVCTISTVADFTASRRAQLQAISTRLFQTHLGQKRSRYKNIARGAASFKKVGGSKTMQTRKKKDADRRYLVRQVEHQVVRRQADRT